MKVKTADLIDAPLDWAVASIEALPKDRLHLFYGKPAIDRECLGRIDTLRCEFSSNWSQGGPIIEREWIELQNGSNLHPDLWGACKWSDTDAGTPLWEGRGPTPLIAAMRCFVASHLGDEIDIPEELL